MVLFDRIESQPVRCPTNALSDSQHLQHDNVQRPHAYCSTRSKQKTLFVGLLRG